MKTIKISITIFIILIINIGCAKAQNENSKADSPSAKENEAITIGEKVKLYSEALGENREILISLPSKYNEHLHSYPIIFVMDADYVSMFDLTRSITGLLSNTDFMPESIVVGLTNNGNFKNRTQMTSGPDEGSGFYLNKAGDYVHFLKNAVLPYMEKNYRVANHKTIIGLSPSNGPLYEALYKHPNTFDAFVFLAADLHFKYSNNESKGDNLIEALSTKKHKKATIYIGMGSKDVEFNPNSGKHFEKYRMQIQKLANPNILCKLEVLDGENHYEMAIKGLKNAFKYMYSNEVWNRQNKYFKGRGEGIIGLKKHFNTLSKYYGFEIFPSEHKLEHQSRALIRWGAPKNIDTAIELLKIGIEYYPNSASLHLLLAEAYKKDANQNSFKLYLQKAKELALKFPQKNYNWFKEKLKEL